MDELEREHEPEAAHVADRPMAPRELLEADEELLPASGGVFDEALVADDVERCVCRRARHDVAAIRAAVGARLPGVEEGPLREDPGEGKPGGDPLGHDDDVGVDAPVLDREQPPGAAESRLDLVRDQEDPMFAGDLAESWQEPRRRDHVAALAEHGLDDDGRHLLRVDELVERQVELGLPVARAGRR